ncbi:two-component system, response regulator [Mariprofundus micogutta]|uniref:Two-component system, response regulator n=1 Tax=Mariprofundus micogutta TaxID=1921010 RepID=A0A1L8CRC7_9PROT|nr:GAF domain-containing SpoIIE family protein phosphatase [Mariprofundus micogutta]GAV21468.1 two-component system, response regulator [Mariprofundus micogutta]
MEQLDLLKQNERLLKALEINQLIAGELHLATLLKQVMSLTQSIMESESCSLFLYDEKSDELVFNACSGENEDQLKEICRLPMGSGIAGWCAEHRETVRIADVYDDPRFEVEYDRQTKFTTRNMISAPLLVRSKLIGVCQVINHQHGVFSESDEKLLESLVPMVAIAIDNAHAHQRLLDRELFQHDLELAKSIQDSFLPALPPEMDGYHAGFHMHSAFDVGGDFYDAIQMPDQRIAYIIGDISGKGVSAAMIMSSILSDIRMELSYGGSAGQILSRFNQALCQKIQSGMFVSLVLMVLDPVIHRLEVANAGHLPPIHIHHERIWQHGEASGPPAGIVSDIQYDCEVISLESGEMVLLYTDGITEARNENDEMIGIGRLLNWLDDAPASTDACIEYLNDCISHYTGNAQQSDDITLLMLGRD